MALITPLSMTELERLRFASKSTHPDVQRGYTWLTRVTRLDYTPNVIEKVDIGPYGSGQGHKEWTTDCMQAWCQTLMYIATGQKVYMDKACHIIKAWCTGCKAFGGSNAPLEMAWGATLLVRCMIVLKHVPEDVRVPFDKFLRNTITNTLTTRYNEIKKWRNNWIFTIIECLMQIEFYKPDWNGNANGSMAGNANGTCPPQRPVDKYITDFQTLVTQAIDPATGLNTDSKRGDPYHFCFQLSSQIAILRMLKHAGLKVSKQAVDLIERSFETHARFLLGQPVPGLTDTCSKYWFTHCNWESANDYFRPRLINVERLLAKNRPETMSFNWGPGWLHAGTFS